LGAKTWMLVYASSEVAATLAARPELDRARSLELAHALFPEHELTSGEEGSLLYTDPRERDLYVGCYADVGIVAAEEFAIDYPSKLPAHFLDPRYGERIVLHAMHSVVDWFAFAVWRHGRLERSLSLSPDNGIIEDIGAKLDFERPFWAGAHPPVAPEDEDPDDPYPLPFHPLELGEAALSELFGYVLEGFVENLAEPRFDPEQFPLLTFHRSRPRRWWQVWRRGPPR
jgi:hypothetical protein